MKLKKKFLFLIISLLFLSNVECEMLMALACHSVTHHLFSLNERQVFKICSYTCVAIAAVALGKQLVIWGKNLYIFAKVFNIVIHHNDDCAMPECNHTHTITKPKQAQIL